MGGTVRVIVTRPAAQAATWVDKLRAQGVDAVALPLIEIVPPADVAPVSAAWRSLGQQAVVFFVSANAVEHFFALRPPGLDWPAATRAAAPGPGTAEALRAAGVPARLIVEPSADAPSFDSEALWACVRNEPWAGRSVLVVRGESGRDWLADQWRSAGATVSYLDAYARRPPTPDSTGRDLLRAAQAVPGAHLWLFSSSEAVRHLLALLQGSPAPGSRALATHPRIAAAARAAGFTVVLECGATEAAVLQAVRGASIQSASP